MNCVGVAGAVQNNNGDETVIWRRPSRPFGLHGRSRKAEAPVTFAAGLYLRLPPRIALARIKVVPLCEIMFLALKHFAAPQRGGVLLLAAACFAAGLSAGAFVAPVGANLSADTAPPPPVQIAALRAGHRAEVTRVLDGDTFEARVRIWPGMDITTRVRLRGIDAPEMQARCDGERSKALAARDALAKYLSEGGVGISRIGQDKYGGRVDADVSTARTPDVSAALLARGLARRYDGGRRESWCG
jgi:endonuclease YncB( thermonuclease family)